MQKVRLWIKKHWIPIAVAVLAVALIVESRYFIDSVQRFYLQGELHPVYYSHTATAPAPAGSASKTTSVVRPSTPTVDSIKLWMTFDYITVVFHLPKNYIKDILGINDPQYPNIRLDTYAKRSHIDPEVLLQTVKQYVTVYKNR